MITTAQAITFTISIFAVLVTIYNLVKNGTKEDSSAITTVIVKLESIESVVKESQRDMKSIQQDVRGIDKRVTKIETVLKLEDDGK